MLVGNAVATGQWVKFDGRNEVEWVPVHWWAMSSTQRGHRRLLDQFGRDPGCERRRADVAHGAVGIGEDIP